MTDLNISNAEYSYCNTDEEVPDGSSIEINCYEGFVLIGPPYVNCTGYEWSETPLCLKGCQVPEPLPHAKFFNLQDVYTQGSQITYVCDDGFFVSTNYRRSHGKITCGASGRWLPEDSGCSLEEKYTVGLIEVEREAPVSLPCVILEEIERPKATDDNGSYLWLKNSKDIKEINLDISVGINGTLTIYSVNKTAEGKYICLFRNQKLIPATMGFNLKLKPIFCPTLLEDKEFLRLRDGSSAIFTCPHLSSEDDLTWFKDGQRYYPHSKQVLFPDGSLYTAALKYSDQGLYTCRILNKDTRCERKHIIDVTVTVSYATICGKVENGYPHPWLVSLWQVHEIAPFCYGSLIHDSWVITSAHCLSGFHRKRKLDVLVRFIYNENQPGKFSFPYVAAKAVKVHPQFSKKTYVNDLGVIQLAQSVNFSKFVRPICLSENDLSQKQPCEMLTATNGTVVGWGPLETNEPVMYLLNESMSVITESDSGCSNTIHPYLENIICAKKRDGTTTTFAGDAGSPFDILWNDRHYLLGVYSWGERAVLIGEHDYLTKINGYFRWLRSFIEISDLEQPQY